MKIAIIGSRDFNNYELLKKTVIQHFPFPDAIVSGGANGADKLGAAYAKELGIPLIEHIPDWDGPLGKGAGFARNTTIVEQSDWIVAFWDGVSKGTADSLSKAKKLKKKTMVIYF
jgi:hypothetical protein